MRYRAKILLPLLAAWMFLLLLYYNNVTYFPNWTSQLPSMSGEMSAISFLSFGKDNNSSDGNDHSDMTSSAINDPYLNNIEDFNFLFSLYRQDSNRRFLVLTEKGADVLRSRKKHKELWGKEPYFSRREEFRSRCENFPSNNYLDLTRMIYDDEHKVVMCVVPKAACTTWKRYMWYLLGKEKNASNIPYINSKHLVLGSHSLLPRLIDLPKVEAMQRLMTYTKFFVSRHPLERLVSAHSSKFTNRSRLSSRYKKGIGARIAVMDAKHHLPGLRYFRNRFGWQLSKDANFNQLNATQQAHALNYIEVMNSGKISFRQLMNYIAYMPSHSVFDEDVHWRPQEALCNPCATSYDFVVRFENLARDSNHLLKYLQRNDPVHKHVWFDGTQSALIDQNKTAQAFHEVNPRVVEKLKKIYANDIKILGYSADGFG